MEENNNFQKADENNKTNESVNFDALINSISEKTVPSQETEPLPEKPKFEGFKTSSILFNFLWIFGVVFLSIFFVFNIYLNPIDVLGLSMYPTINADCLADDDNVRNDMVYYREKNSYTYGDIVIVSNETQQYIKNGSVNFLIKRVVACPGDTIIFSLTDIDSDKHLYYYDIVVKNPSGKIVEINDESYINEPMYIYFDPSNPYEFNDFFANIAPNIVNDSLTNPEDRISTITISNNSYFVMGDNRNHSSDSRSFGEVKSLDICGNVRLHVKHGESLWTSIFRKLKSLLSVNYSYLKENL